MSWLIPLLLSSAMFASGNSADLPPVNINYANAAAKTVVQADETERFEQIYPLNANGKVSVSNVNGSITVDVWDNPQVKLEYVKTADSRERLSEVEVKIDARQDSFTIETNFDRWKQNEQLRRKNNKFEIQYHLTVPRAAILDEISTVNGSVNIKDAAGATRASTVNGEVNATNLRGAANLSTVNGTVRADFDALQTGGRISLETVNGTAEMMVPSDASATVRADTLNGEITNDFGLPVRKGQFVGRKLYGRIGNEGGAQIRLNSVNGALMLKRKNDGKNASPATNLLSSKNEEEDWDNDEDGSRAPRLPRPPRPARPAAPPAPPGVVIDNEEIRRAVEDGLKEAQKEIGKMQPELEKIRAQAAIEQAAAVMKSPEIQARVRAAQDRYQAAMERMANADWGAPRIEEKSESFAVKGTPRVIIEAGNCAVTVRGWDKQEVRYAATRVSRAQTPLDLKAALEGDSIVNIKVGGDKKGDALGDFYFDGANRARIEIFVPRKSDLKIKTGGEIRLEGVSGAIDLQGAGESINVRDAGGSLNVGTSDGTIRVVNFRGAFDGKTADGTMNLEGAFESLNALASGDGAIVLTLADDAGAVLESSAEIESDGVNLIRPNAREKIWRVGAGGAVYRFSVAADGRVVVRGAGALKTIL